jgi:hypothetical protein
MKFKMIIANIKKVFKKAHFTGIDSGGLSK